MHKKLLQVSVEAAGRVSGRLCGYEGRTVSSIEVCSVCYSIFNECSLADPSELQRASSYRSPSGSEVNSPFHSHNDSALNHLSRAYSSRACQSTRGVVQHTWAAEVFAAEWQFSTLVEPPSTRSHPQNHSRTSILCDVLRRLEVFETGAGRTIYVDIHSQEQQVGLAYRA